MFAIADKHFADTSSNWRTTLDETRWASF